MSQRDLITVLNLVLNDKLTRTIAVFVTVFSSIIAITFSPLAAFIIYLAYILGYLVCWILIKYQNKTSGHLQRLISFYRGNVSPKKNIRHSCSICDDLSCRRHFQSKDVAPWKDLIILKELNDSLEHFYDHILDNFISSWYEQFTTDGDFIQELRSALRYATASAVNTFLKLDYSDVIATKLVPCAVKHIDDYLYMIQITKLKNVKFNDVIVEYLGKRLHTAATNRKNELSYLQHLTEALLPFILPDQYLHCRNYSVLIREILAGWVFLPLMDVLADPNVLNYLVILGVNYRSNRKHKYHGPQQEVEFLENFVHAKKEKSLLATDLNTIKSNTDLLYVFMQFLKKEEQVHLLQFCLDVDAFNNKLLTPDLTKKQLQELHAEAVTLYKEYLNASSYNSIGCPKDIVQNYSRLLDHGVYSVAKLRTSKPLYQAYEYAFNTLENDWLPQFFHCNEFYSYLCGSKVTAKYNKAALSRSPLFGSPNRAKSKKYDMSNQGAVSKISSGLGKIRGALKPNQPVDGAIYAPESQTYENGGIEDSLISNESVHLFRDMSSWRISISSYDATNKIIHFCINIQRLDTVSDDTNSNWFVLRKDQDFYTLKSKLVEFHGENMICDSPLPSRKMASSIDTRMAKYEEFLKRLLQKPTLRGSDLLHSFLTTKEDFTMLVSTSADLDLGNIYQSVAHKLRKERGQHLDSFMNTFLTSAGKTKAGKFEWGADIADEIHIDQTVDTKVPPIPKTYRNHIFNDNFGISSKDLKDTSSGTFHPIGIVECAFYLGKYIFKAPNVVLKLYAALCSVSQQAVESITRIILEKKLKSGLCQSNLAYLIKLLEGVIFEHHVHPTKQELEERKVKAYEGIKSVVPPIIQKVMGTEFSEGFVTLLDILQHPHYNKHLAYNLLDIIMTEMYPDLCNNGNLVE